MGKYYKAEDVIDTLAEQWHFEATIECPYAADDIEEWKENARELFADLSTIEVCEDCISREYLKSFEYINKGDFNSVETIREWIDNAPSVVVRNNRTTTEQSSMVGEWIDWLGKGNEWECSECKCSIESHGSIAYNYRPNCGAKMKGAENE